MDLDKLSDLLLSDNDSTFNLTDLDSLSDTLLCSTSDKNMNELLNNFLDKLNILDNSFDITNNILFPITNKEIIPTTNKEINKSTIGIIGNNGLLKYIEIRMKQIIIDEKSIANINLIQERIKERFKFDPIPENTTYKTIQSFRRPKKRGHIYTKQIMITSEKQIPKERPKLLFIRKKDILPLTQNKIKTTHRSYGKYENKLSIDRWRGIIYEAENDELEDLYYSQDNDTDSINLYQKDMLIINQRKSQTYAARRRY